MERVDSNRVLNLIHTQNYLVLRAPRQTGKTSVLIALQDHLNSGAAGNYRCLYVTIEGALTHAKTWEGQCGRFWGGLPHALE